MTNRTDLHFHSFDKWLAAKACDYDVHHSQCRGSERNMLMLAA